MGFRDPITSISGPVREVDTSEDPAGPGARLYQDDDGDFPRGVLALRTGVPGSDPAHLTLTSYQEPDPLEPGAIRALGNSVALTGAASNGIPPAALELDVSEAPAGGYRSVARILADLVDIPGLPIPVDSKTERDALAKHKGLTVIRTDTPEAREERWNGTKWTYSTWGFASLSSDAAGYIVVPHGLDEVPTAVQVTPGPQFSQLLNLIVDFVWVNADAYAFVLLLRRDDTSVELPSQAVQFSWQAFT